MQRWAGRYRRLLVHATRITAASLMAYVLVYSFSLPEGLWAVITAVVVVQSSLAGSLKVAFEQLAGSIFGAIYATALVLLIAPSDFLTSILTLILALGPLAILAALSPGFRIAPITAIIMLLGGPGLGLEPVDLASSRILEVGVGCIAGILVSLIVVPARASRSVLDKTALVANLMARQLEALASRESDRKGEVGLLAGQVREEVTRLEILVQEATHERRIWLTDLPDLEPLARTTRRLRHGIGMLRRAPREGEGKEGDSPTAQPWQDALEAGAATLQQIGQVLSGEDVTEDLDRLAKAVRAYRGALDQMRKDRLTQDLSTETLGRLFGASFALDQFRRDLEDLVSRCKEITAARQRGRHLFSRKAADEGVVQ
ncbi:MAG TPA: FUSC family protein [Kiloniellales bacterium]|jgi:uncharacterized membrane protein YccC|nr:FUSC family protein [Kiloniellales bacterium]